MRVAEAKWIAERLREISNEQLSPLVNIGSSTAKFREVSQPHIDGLIFAPLRARGVDVIHTDLKAQEGVEIHGDLMAPEVQGALRARRPRSVLCSNLLEHVPDPGQFAAVIAALVEPTGLLLVTVPRSYPFHADPIDTGFRPGPDELAALFAGTQLLHGQVVEDSTYAAELIHLGAAGVRRGLRTLLGALRPRGDVGRAQRDKLRWLFRPFSTTCVVMKTRGG